MKKLTALLLLLPVLAIADPGAATRYLMNEPASLMDIGLLRAQLTLDEKDRIANDMTWYKESEDFRIDSGIGYDFERDLLFLDIVLTSADNPKSMCGIIMRQYAITVKVGLRHWFMHSEYTTSNTPNDLVSQLEKGFELQCRFFGDESRTVTVGKRMFLVKDISWTDDIALGDNDED